MPPITTADFVGLDVHKAIVDNLYELTNDYVHDKFVMPSYVQHLIDNGMLGRKAGQGLYKLVKNESGEKRMMVFIRLDRDIGNLWKRRIEVIVRVGTVDGGVFGRYMPPLKLNTCFGEFVESAYRLAPDLEVVM
jgi:3-hydroxyacyl-CoA dehydrogenase